MIKPCPESFADLHLRFTTPKPDLSAAKREEVLSIIARIFESHPNLNTIDIYGYTPGFNDGDPCVHTQQDPYFNGLDMYGGVSSTFDEDGESLPYDIAKERYRVFAPVAEVLGGMTNLIHEAFGTDWAIRFKRSEDGITFDLREYECGY